MKWFIGGIWFCLAATVALAGDVPKFTEAANGFAFELCRQILPGQGSRNLFLSPYSAGIALQMLCNGAGGKTRTEIEHALNTANLSPDKVNGFYKGLNGALTSQTNVVLDLSNSIWINRGFELKPGFVCTNEAFFGALLSSVNFETPESAEMINQWAANSTRGKISGIVSFPFPANTQMLLANAIYFKGEWADRFDARLTRGRYFYPGGGIIKQTPMMSRRGKFRYTHGDGFQAVELPYAGDRLRMIVFLPVTNSSPSKLLARFNGTDWGENILPRFVSREGTVVLPKFKLDCRLLLNDPLGKMGMQGAFIPGTANFSRISNDPLFVSEVLQKSFVDVNEEGTEAAAVTTVMVVATAAMRPVEPFKMIVNRPFFFVICDAKTGTILFMGVVNDPTAA